jgi:hypothetical protein
LQFQNRTKQDAGLANQCSAFHFGLSVRINSRKAATDFPASKCRVLTNGLGMLVRDNFTTPFPFLKEYDPV